MNPILTPEAANEAIENFATTRGLLFSDDSSHHTFAWLDGALDEHRLMWREFGDVCHDIFTFFVISGDEKRLITAGHPTPEAAYDAALAQVTPQAATSPQRMTAAEANAEIQRFVNETRSPRTGDGHQFGINHHGRAVAPLGGLMAGFDLTWRGENAGTQIGFCVVEALTGNQVTAHHPTPEAAFDAALEIVQAAMRDHRPNPHATTIPKPTTERDDASGNRALADAHAALCKPKPPSATSGGHLDAPSPSLRQLTYEAAALVGAAALHDFAPRNGLDMVEIDVLNRKRDAVSLGGILAGCLLTWVYADGRLGYSVKDEPSQKWASWAKPSVEEAYDAALAYRMGKQKAKQAKPATPGATSTVPQPTSRPRVYICHPYSDDPTGNAAKVAAICKRLVAEGLMPIAPQVYLAAFVDDATERDTAMALCMDLMRWCDEVRVYGPDLSPGMLEELRFAMARGMTITHHSAEPTP